MKRPVKKVCGICQRDCQASRSLKQMIIKNCPASLPMKPVLRAAINLQEKAQA
jgi:hypothetical protein